MRPQVPDSNRIGHLSEAFISPRVFVESKLCGCFDWQIIMCGSKDTSKIQQILGSVRYLHWFASRDDANLHRMCLCTIRLYLLGDTTSHRQISRSLEPARFRFNVFCHCEIWMGSRHHCCRDTCQISRRHNNFYTELRGFEDFATPYETWDTSMPHMKTQARF